MLLPLIQTFHLQDTHVIPNLLEHDTIINSVLNGNIDIGFTELTPEIRKHKQLHMLPSKSTIIYMRLQTIQLRWRHTHH